MSELFMDMQRHRHRWHNQQNLPPPTTSTTTTTTTASATTTTSPDSPSSALQQHLRNDHIFSHRSKNSSTAGETIHYNKNHNFNNRKNTKICEHNNNNDVDPNDADDAFDNILSLKLKKPQHWKWELSTSKSCSNIALPRILLYDHKGKLLADAKGDNEGVYTPDEQHKMKRDKTKKRTHHQTKSNSTNYQQRAATVNLTHSIRQALEKEFNGLHIQEATPSPQPHTPTSLSSRCSRKAIDLSTNDLPDYVISRSSSSLRGVHFNVENDKVDQINESHVPEFLPTPPSTTTTTRTTSSSSGPREKRKYRRSQSSGRSSAHSESILERFSYQKGRFSSPEYADETKVEHAPRYFLRTCKAGTLVIKEDSFCQHPRRRRRPLKNRSTESLQSVQKSPFTTTLNTRQLTTCKSPILSDTSCKRKQQPLLHYNLPDSNVLLRKQLSTSEDDVANLITRKPLIDENVGEKHLRKYPQGQNQTKDLNYATDIHQDGKAR